MAKEVPYLPCRRAMWRCCSVSTSDKIEAVETQDIGKPAVPSAATKDKANASNSTTTATAPPTKAALEQRNGKLMKKGSRDNMESCETASIASTQKSSRSAFSAASSVNSDFINDKLPVHQREVARIQSQMKAFVKGMVKGREMNVLSVDGQLRQCVCSFDRKLRNYNIVISKETRSIKLSDFTEVLQGREPKDIATPLDDLCATFVLSNGECLTFRFGDVKEREDFAMCLQIIVDGHQ